MEQDTTCPYCNERPLGKRKDARTCGDKACQRARNHETFSREKDREHKRKVRAADPDLGKDWMTCPECGDMFLGYPNQVRCSIACANKSRAEDPAVIAARRAERAYWRRARECPVEFGECVACGRTFSFDPRWGRTTCSDECSKMMRSNRRRPWRKFASRVYERDGFTCWLCNTETLTEYVMGDPLSPSLDHVVPRSRGGDDAMGNLRTAHMICNAYRRDREDVISIDLEAILGQRARHKLAA